MDNTNAPNNTDIIESLKAVPDIRKRLIFAVLALVSVFAPVITAGGFGLSASVSLAVLFGNLVYLLPILAVLVVVAPIVPVLQANSRIIDLANGAAAAYVVFVVLKTLVQALELAGRSYGGFNPNQFGGSMTPSWGLLVFAVYLWFAMARSIRAIRSRPASA
jgi:hypothetical protein